ncbi:hypothetical protein WR25_04599 [Diploscapter pachys]|uniref:Uncharacterized protein n=1 Tax=Diploscapter pachys TaxID=2018661 RepID=A0A2A2LKR5_9BILA|nr:hypothetical protein WR25_04599 [Diploscapter pachys]
MPSAHILRHSRSPNAAVVARIAHSHLVCASHYLQRSTLLFPFLYGVAYRSILSNGHNPDRSSELPDALCKNISFPTEECPLPFLTCSSADLQAVSLGSLYSSTYRSTGLSVAGRVQCTEKCLLPSSTICGFSSQLSTPPEAVGAVIL